MSDLPVSVMGSELGGDLRHLHHRPGTYRFSFYHSLRTVPATSTSPAQHSGWAGWQPSWRHVGAFGHARPDREMMMSMSGAGFFVSLGAYRGLRRRIALLGQRLLRRARSRHPRTRRVRCAILAMVGWSRALRPSECSAALVAWAYKFPGRSPGGFHAPYSSFLRLLPRTRLIRRIGAPGHSCAAC